MTDREIKLVVGALLHDIGKIVYRSGDNRKHSASGYELLKEDMQISDKEVLDCIRYHHGDALSSAKLEDDALAYIVYIADNIAAASDRRENEEQERGFNPQIPLQSIFNILNDNSAKYHYFPDALDDEGGINMPTEADISFDKFFYERIQGEMLDTLQGIENWKEEYIHSLLSTMEAYLSYIPSSTAVHELADISLFDHVKMTAAYSSCIYQYLAENGVTDYKTELFKNAKEFYQKKAFRLFSMDISGIQKFIYTIHSKHALRMLRARSFYLEILMEHMIDEILEKCGISRTNLIYSGGGHCYLLLPNTKKSLEKIEEAKKEFNTFFLEEFDIALYVAAASVECSAHDLENIPDGSYRELFQNLGKKLSEQKTSRYTVEQIRYLNQRKRKNDVRECRVCKNTSLIKEDGMCNFCYLLKGLSNDVLYQEFFTVFDEDRDNAIPLPGNRFLLAQSEETLKESMEKDDYFVRTYGKNKFYTGKSVTTKLWVGDYTQKGKNTSDYAKEAKGIDRIAVLRADVDNLGHAFVNGFPEKYTTLSRTATLSRQLSLFFKHHINGILKHGEYSLDGTLEDRKASIVYSGGDDLFIVGAWKDVIELAVDIEQKFREYSIGTLTISAGIGMFSASYPLRVSALDVAEMEEESKNYPKDSPQPLKNALTVLEETYPWKEFKESVVQEKLKALEHYLERAPERGMAFLYRLLELIRGMDDRINLARFAYVLARMEPDQDKTEEEKEAYRTFSRIMYQWAQNERERTQLVTAIYLYVYLHRKGEEE